MDLATVVTTISISVTIVGIVVGVPAAWHHCRDSWRRRRRRGSDTERYAKAMGPVEHAARRKLYYYPGGWAGAVELWGRDTDFVSHKRLCVSYHHEPFVVPPELKREFDQFIEQRKAEAKEQGSLFFNGPNARLIDWRPNASEAAGVAREDTQIELTLGPVGWYPYEFLNNRLRLRMASEGDLSSYEFDTSLTQEILPNCSVRKSRLTNIVDNAITLVTKDGYVGYQVRSNRVSAVAKKLTSAVAENVNRYKDDTHREDLRRLFNDPFASQSNDRGPDDSYVPQGVPHPFSAVRRGIAEELSPRILDHLRWNATKLIGISFDLSVAHPDLLWAAFVDLAHADVLVLCDLYGGKDFYEGQLNFVPCEFINEETRRLLGLEEPGWVPAGKASLIRTIKLIDAIKKSKGCSFGEAFQYLRDAD